MSVRGNRVLIKSIYIRQLNVTAVARLLARAIGCASCAPVDPTSGEARSRTAHDRLVIRDGTRSSDAWPWLTSNIGVLRTVADAVIMIGRKRRVVAS